VSDGVESITVCWRLVITGRQHVKVVVIVLLPANNKRVISCCKFVRHLVDARNIFGNQHLHALDKTKVIFALIRSEMQTIKLENNEARKSWCHQFSQEVMTRQIDNRFFTRADDVRVLNPHSDSVTVNPSSRRVWPRVPRLSSSFRP